MTDLEVPDAEIADIVLPALGLSDPDDDGSQRRSMSSRRTEMLARPNVPGLPTVGIWRVRGEQWSAILKVLREPTRTSAWAGHPDPTHPFYWRREADVYARLGTRFSHSEPEPDGGGGIRMPRCYGVSDRDDGSVAIWMEDVNGTPASEWSLARCGLFARQFAEFHVGPMASSLAMEQVAEPTAWLSRDWLRTYVGRRDPVGDVLADPAVWGHPAVRDVLDVNHSGQFLELWRRRYGYLADVDAQPRVLCHLDMHPLNLFDVDGETVLIDWAFCGVGGLGEDLGTLVVDAISDFHLAPDYLAPLFETVVTSYAAASATYDEVTVRKAVASAALARFAWLVPALISALIEGGERINGRPLDQAAPVWGAACHFLLDLAESL